jgi:hypothetical protein
MNEKTFWSVIIILLYNGKGLVRNECLLCFRTVRGKLPFTRQPAQGASSASLPWWPTGLTLSKYLQLFLPTRDVVKALY